MERPIEINYMKDEASNEMMYKVCVFVNIPQGVEDIKKHILTEYKKANVIEQLEARLNEY